MSDAADSPAPLHPLVEVGRYSRLAEARQRGTVVAASDLPHWIERDGDEWVLRVEAPGYELAEREVAAFEREEAARPAELPPAPEEPLDTLSLYVAAWLLSGFFLTQNLLGEWWIERGVASSAAILRDGEWWRTLTALTLHGDMAHIAANLCFGLMFVAFVLPHLGVGVTWLAVLLSGAVGNAINAWGYRGEAHPSIGASTAVFGALGLLVGAECVSRLRSPQGRSRWQLLVPLGAGLAFLAFLGVGEEGRHVDIMAHLWGLVAGVPLGLLLAAARVKERASKTVQRLAALAAVLALGGAWVWALEVAASSPAR